MPRNSIVNLDESKIIKKDTTQPVNNNVISQPTTPVEQTPKQEVQTVITPVVEPPIQPVVENVVITPIEEKKEIINDKSAGYFEILKQYETEQKVIQDGKKNEAPTEPKIPIFTYSKNISTGQISIEPKNPKIIKDENEDTNVIKKEELTGNHVVTKKLLDAADENITRTELEIAIHLEIMKTENNPDQKKLYETKLKSFKNDLDYYRRRKSILEDLLKNK